MVAKLKDTLLLVGDDHSSRKDLRSIFGSSYHLLEAENVLQATMLIRQNSHCIAAILADIPIGNGEDLRTLVATGHIDPDNEIPVTFFDSDTAEETEELAFILGAAQVIRKPYSTLTVQRRVGILVDLYLHRWKLEKLVQEQNETIRHSSQAVMDALSTIIEYRNAESGNHVLRIRRFVRILLEDVAQCYPEYELNDVTIDIITSASALHDIGKISIPDSILNKPGPLTAEEFEIMKKHSLIGSQLVEQLKGIGDMTYLRYAYNIALSHHERWDGKGYPYGLKGDEIPISAQVVGLADTFDALTSQRVYKQALPYETSFHMILNGECGTFSPKLLECFKHVRQPLIDLAMQYADGYSPKSDDIRVPLPNPIQKTYELDSLQLSQLKYQTLMHYTNDTIMEIDMESHLYHVVYNPNPDLEFLFSNASFDELMDRMIQDGIHPGDVKKLEEIKTFFSVHPQLQSIRKRRFACRIFSPTEMEYWPYKVTVLRMNTDNPSQNLLLIIFHKEKENMVELTNSDQDDPDPLDLSHLMCCVLRCRSDENLTILNGARSLFALTGYDVAEIETQFHNSLLNMIHPDDQWVLTVLTRQFTQESGKIQTEFRMLQKNHAPIWVLCNTRSYLRKNGIEYFYHSLTDITSVKETQTNLASTVLHHQLILDHLSSIVFEWDLAKDTLICTDKWEKRFGYPPTSQEFHLQLERATHFHPDDLPFIRQKAESMLKGKKQEEMDVRILDHNGNYIWNKICANTLFDDKGCPTYIIGEITDIDELKKAALSMREQAETDALTKLFNKASTQRLISSHLSESHAQETDCLLLLDLDNFKTVNDSYGHMYGDTLLTQVGNTLRKMFRSCDIIGRVGGDEFMVFIKDIPSLDSIQTRCQLLLDAFRELLQNLMPDLNVSCSIGAALIPEHGSTYTELYQHADEALYDAKTSGKDQYKIYHPPVKNETISK